jgi:hypothetical protein
MALRHRDDAESRDLRRTPSSRELPVLDANGIDSECLRVYLRGMKYTPSAPAGGQEPDGAAAMPLVKIRGRGAAHNPPNRFERIDLVPDLDELDREYDPEAPGPSTVYLRDATRTVLAHNDSPDVGFDVSVNPYRGCEHGCLC